MVEALKNVKLYYFGINGNAFLPRILMYYAKIPFENVIVTKKEEHQPNMEFKFFPNLEIDGKMYSQTKAISVFLARKIGGLMGDNDEEEYLINSLIECRDDIIKKLLPIAFASDEEKKNPEIMQKKMQEAIDSVKIFADGWETRYKNLGSGRFYLGKKLSLADFFLVHFVHVVFGSAFKELHIPFKESAPTLSKTVAALINEEPFKGYLESKLFVPDTF